MKTFKFNYVSDGIYKCKYLRTLKTQIGAHHLYHRRKIKDKK